MANSHIGEIAIHTEGRDYVFRPFFSRLAEIGSPKEIFELFTQAQEVTNDGFIAAWRVLVALCDDDDTDELLGYFTYEEDGLTYHDGQVPKHDIHVLGCKLICDAVIGRPTQRDRAKMNSSKTVDSFDPAEFVAIGYAHFGGVNWWDKTMIELQLTIKAHNPEKEEAMTHDDVTKLFDELDRRKGIKKG